MRLLLTFSLLLLPLLTACALAPGECQVCHREIHSSVRSVITLEGGKRVSVCCPRCALHYREQSGKRLKVIQVTDHVTGDLLPLDRAYLVEGSRLTPCLRHPHPAVMDETRTPLRLCYDRCMPSLIAFGSLRDAQTFVAGQGGDLLPPGALAAELATGKP